MIVTSGETMAISRSDRANALRQIAAHVQAAKEGRLDYATALMLIERAVSADARRSAE